MSHLLIVTPLYNDWDSLSSLIVKLNNAFEQEPITISILAVNDASPYGELKLQTNQPLNKIKKIKILNLARNIGHQRAIAVGLAYASKNIVCDTIIVMDSDGEDRPEDALSLFKTGLNQEQKIIFARRSQRSEGIIFKVFYSVYKFLFGLLTGVQINFGNFSLIPYNLMKRIVLLPEIWNHYAAGIIRSGLPRTDIPTTRGKRYAGKSRMNLINLILHGLSAISVYVEVVAVRLIIFSLSILSLVGLSFVILLYIRFFTPLAIPGWATTVAIGLAVIFFQALLFLTSLSFLTLNLRSNRPFIPAQDYQDFILNIEEIL